MVLTQKTHEEEVQLRLQFESKLNGLHSLHRDLQAKYDRALQDILSLETIKGIQREKVDRQNDELLLLRSNKIDNEATISFQAEKIKTLQLECEQKQKQSRDLENKLTAAHGTIEKRNIDIKEAEYRANQATIVQDTEKMLVAALKVEKKHLESSLKENTELKDAFRAKNEDLQIKYEEIFKECEHYKRQLVGIDELRKDRDERLEQLRKEIEDLTQKNE